jgi:hypothetical protein
MRATPESNLNPLAHAAIGASVPLHLSESVAGAGFGSRPPTASTDRMTFTRMTLTRRIAS